MIKMKSLWALVVLSVVCSVGIALEGGVDRFVSSINGNDLGSPGQGLNDCRDPARPCKTIRQALARAGKEDVIRVLPGPPYEECGLEIKQQVRIVSEGIRAVIGPDPEKRAIDASKKADEADDPLCPHNSLFVFQISGDKAKGTTIERLSFRGRFAETADPKEQPALLVVKDTSGIVIKENQFTVKKIAGDKENTGVGLKLLNSSFKEITNNEIKGTLEPVGNAQGIVLLQVQSESGSGTPLTLSGNKISNHGGDGILIKNVNLTEPRLRILANTIERNKGHGVNVHQVSGLTIEANQIVNNMKNGIELFCKDSACERIVLKDNTITGNKGSEGGIHLGGSGEAVQYNDIEISNNTIQRNSAAGLVLVGGQYGQYSDEKKAVTIIDNRLERNVVGIEVTELKGGSWLRLTNNNISGSTGAIKEEKGGQKKIIEGDGLKIKLADATSATKLTVSGNTTDQNAGSGLVLEGSNTTLGSEIKIEGLKSRGNKEGIVLKGSQKITIEDSQLIENKCAGLVLDDLTTDERGVRTVIAVSSGTVSKNIIAANGRNCPRDPTDPPLSFQINGGGVVLKGGSNNNDFVHNVLDRNLNGVSLRLSAPEQPREGNRFLCNTISTSDHSGILVLPEANVTALPGSFNNNNIVGNLGFGLRNFTNIEINAQQNWWGHATGPFHAELNPQGKGDRILGPADFNNWLTQSVDINRCP